MGIPNRQIGWDQQSNLLWQLQAQLNKLGKTMSQCCGSSTAAGCISFTDITWEAFITAVNAGTIADCYYNITNRPNSGTDPLYVLVEKGLPNFDNEVRRSEQATSALCITTDQGVGCFNVYAEEETISFDYVENAVVYPIGLKDCSIFAEGDTVTFTSFQAPFPTYTGVIHYTYNDPKKGCETFFQITGGTGPIPPSPLNPDGNFSNGVDNTNGVLFAAEADKNCDPFPTLSVGDSITSNTINGLIQATITSISGTTVTIAPTSGDWTGVTVFYIGDNQFCLFVTTAPITTTSILLTPDPVCFDFNNLLGQGVYLNTLMQATDGLIYGTLAQVNNSRGQLAQGQLFSMDPVTEQVTILFNFDDYNTYGGYPNAGVVEIAGELYGTCNGGGSGVNPGGTIWKWNIATNTLTVLHTIDANSQEGLYPYGTLLYTGGKLYGTCENGGFNDAGTLFEFDPIANTYTVLNWFANNGDVANPQGPLVEVIPGELWGTSYGGGTNNLGTVFKYTLSTGSEEVVVNLDDISVSGEYIGASGGVMLASDGNVYFNTNYGGDNDNGTLCQITDISTSPSLNVVYSFDVDYGYGDAVCPVEIAGNLYGCTNDTNGPIFIGECNPPLGSIYKYDLSVGIFTTLYTFNAQIDGGSPYLGQLLPLGDVLYGMTNQAPSGKGCPIGQFGQIFKYNLTTETYTNIQALGAPVSTPAEVAESICASIVDPGYTCTTVGGCLFVSGTQFGNEAGQTLVVRTIVTFIGNLDGCTAPTVGQLLYNDITGDLIGTVISFVDDDPFTMEVELNDNANPGYTSLPFDGYIEGVGCVFPVLRVNGTILDYTVQPFEGGKEPVNRPCYYNATYDVITDYPLSQPHTKAEIDYLVNNNLLVPGAFYHIMDVDKFLYGGTQIVIQANSHHAFNDTAMGLFYNPKYDQSVAGFGIYNSDIEYSIGDTAIWGGLVITYAAGGSIGNASPYNREYGQWTFPGKFKVFVDDASVFTAGEIVYDPNNPNNSMLITEVGADYIIVSCPPLFLAFATFIVNGVDSAGITSIELHESFYSDLIYNAVWDEITYDYAHDFISSRKDNAGNVVEQSWNNYKLWNKGIPTWRAIAGFQWGNEYAYNVDLDDTVGMYGNKITESYVEVINFTLSLFTNNIFESSRFLNNIFDRNGGSIFYNIFQNESYVENVEFINTPGFNRNVFNSSNLIDSTIDGSNFSDNTLNNSGIEQIPSGGTTSFANNAVKGSQLDLSTQTGNIERTNFDYVILNDDISAASRIYQTTYAKEVVSSNGAGNFIKYVSATGTYIVAAVTV
jgi:uncharacterized repeat protein (TIGR03803 family)